MMTLEMTMWKRRTMMMYAKEPNRELKMNPSSPFFNLHPREDRFRYRRLCLRQISFYFIYEASKRFAQIYRERVKANQKIIKIIERRCI